MTGVLFRELAYGRSQPSKSPASCDLKLSLDFGITHVHVCIHLHRNIYTETLIKIKLSLETEKRKRMKLKDLGKQEQVTAFFFSSRMLKKFNFRLKKVWQILSIISYQSNRNNVIQKSNVSL